MSTGETSPSGWRHRLTKGRIRSDSSGQNKYNTMDTIHKSTQYKRRSSGQNKRQGLRKQLADKTKPNFPDDGTDQIRGWRKAPLHF